MTPPAKGTQCAAYVASGAWHSYSCQSPARYHVAGKDWCGTHNPEREARAKSEQDVREALGQELSTAFGNMMRAQRNLVERLRRADYLAGSFLQPYVEDLKAADARYVEARRNADANGKVRRIWYPHEGRGNWGAEGLSEENLVMKPE